VKHNSLKMLPLLHQFLMTKLCQTFMIISWTVNRFEKHILQFGTRFYCFNDRSLN